MPDAGGYGIIFSMNDENGFSPFEEFGEEQENTRPVRRLSFLQWALTGFFVLALAAVVIALTLGAPAPALQYAGEPQLETGAPAETAAPEPDPTPEAVIPATEPVETPPAADIVYVRTALVSNGEVIGVLASREAAEELLNEVLSYYAALTVEPDAAMSFDPPITLENAAADAVTVGHDELLAAFTGEKPPVDVVAEVSVEITEPIAYKTVTKNDRYLVKGTRIIENYGCDGEQTLTTNRRYVNGELTSVKDSQAEVVKEPVDARIRVGIQKLTNKAPDKKQGGKGKNTELEFADPVSGDISANYGQTDGILHLGLDYKADEGEEVKASCAGTVVCVMERGGYGLVVEIDHGEGFLTRYAHLKSASVKIGDAVAAGDTIGAAGMTGNAEKAHLHFELRIDGEAYNPRYYLD